MKLDITIYVLNIHRLFMHNTFQMLDREATHKMGAPEKLIQILHVAL